MEQLPGRDLVELEAHASSLAHLSRRFSSASLGSLVSNEPIGTSPAGS